MDSTIGRQIGEDLKTLVSLINNGATWDRLRIFASTLNEIEAKVIYEIGNYNPSEEVRCEECGEGYDKSLGFSVYENEAKIYWYYTFEVNGSNIEIPIPNIKEIYYYLGRFGSEEGNRRLWLKFMGNNGIHIVLTTTKNLNQAEWKIVRRILNKYPEYILPNASSQ